MHGAGARGPLRQDFIEKLGLYPDLGGEEEWVR